MIWESWPWKRDLLRVAKSLQNRKSQARWPQSSLYALERDIFHSAYAIRKLLEAKKLSDKVSASSISASAFTPKGKVVDLLNWHKIERLYDLATSMSVTLPIIEYCNQVIHSFVFVPCFDESCGGFCGFFVSSDRARKKRLLMFNIDEVIALLVGVGEDDIVRQIFSRDSKGEMQVVRAIAAPSAHGSAQARPPA